MMRPRRVSCRCLSRMPTRFQSQSSVGFGSSARHSSRCGQVRQNGAGVLGAAHEAGAAGIGAEVARERLVDFVRGLDAERDELGSEEAALEIGGDLLDRSTFRERLQERSPRKRHAAAEVPRARLAEARRALADEDVALVVESAPARAAEHLEQVGRRDFARDATGGEAGRVTSTDRSEKLMPALRPSVATTTRSWPPLASGSTSPARWT